MLEWNTHSTAHLKMVQRLRLILTRLLSIIRMQSARKFWKKRNLIHRISDRRRSSSGPIAIGHQFLQLLSPTARQGVSTRARTKQLNNSHNGWPMVRAPGCSTRARTELLNNCHNGWPMVRWYFKKSIDFKIRSILKIDQLLKNQKILKIKLKIENFFYQYFKSPFVGQQASIRSPLPRVAFVHWCVFGHGHFVNSPPTDFSGGKSLGQQTRSFGSLFFHQFFTLFK